MLNPSVHFQPLTDQARSVLLLGGTLQPFSYTTTMLFPHIAPERLRLFSCGHVVPPSHVKAVAVGAGPTGGRLEFVFDRRLSIGVTDELHASLKQILEVVPMGVVVFFTSFQYMEAVVARWRANKMLQVR